MVHIASHSHKIRGSTMVCGVGESIYTKRGKSAQAPFKMALTAILAACKDAEIDPHEIDGFASYSDEKSEPSRLAAALGIRELRHASLFWGGGGGGICGAIENAACAIATGQARCVVVFRSISQPPGKRYGQAGGYEDMAPEFAHIAPYGVFTPAQLYSLKINKFLIDNGISPAPMRNIALASYQHAQNNPKAVMYKRPLTEEMYDDARPIVDPLKLYDCCLETDGAAALILVAAERKDEFKQPPCYLLAASSGMEGRAAASILNAPDFASANFKPVAKRLFEKAQITPSDIDVIQSYENFTGGVLMSLIEHGLCPADEAEAFFTLPNLTAPNGIAPLNTSGGHLAEAYVQGMNLCVEAVRQIRGQSVNQSPNAKSCLVTGGPLIAPVSSAIFAGHDLL